MRRTLAVRRTLARTHGRTDVPVGQDAPLGPAHRAARDCVASLERYKQRQDIDRRDAGEAWKDTGLVFATAMGGPLDPAWK